MRMYFSGTPGPTFGWPEDFLRAPQVMLTFWDFTPGKKNHPARKRFFAEVKRRKACHANVLQR